MTEPHVKYCEKNDRSIRFTGVVGVAIVINNNNVQIQNNTTNFAILRKRFQTAKEKKKKLR